MILTAVWLLLRASGERLEWLGLDRGVWKSAVLRGAVYAAVIFVLTNLVLSSLLATLLGSHGTSPAMQALFRDPREAPYWVFAAVVGGGFAEELERVHPHALRTRLRNGGADGSPGRR